MCIRDRVAPGDIRYVDVNGDGKITADDETAIGYSMLPEIVYGLNLGVNWKGIDASILFQGTGHSDIICLLYTSTLKYGVVQIIKNKYYFKNRYYE